MKYLFSLLLFIFLFTINTQATKAACGTGDRCCPNSCQQDSDCTSNDCEETANLCFSANLEDYHCTTGTPTDMNDSGFFECRCIGDEPPGIIGDPCDGYCISGECIDNICRPPVGECTNLKEADKDTAEEQCARAESYFCELPRVGLNFYCCTNQNICENLNGKGNEPSVTIECTTNKGDKGIDSAIGCIPYDNIDELLLFFIGWSTGVIGGIAFVLIVISGFFLLLFRSSNDPGKQILWKDIFISAVSGLLLAIFSVFLLRIIGVNILDIL